MNFSDVHIEKEIDAFVAEKKRIQINPYFSIKIIQRIEKKESFSFKVAPVFQYILVSSFFLLIIFMGIWLGGIYYSYTFNNYATTNDNIEYLSPYLNIDNNLFSYNSYDTK